MLQIPVVDIYLTGACNLQCQYCFGELDTKPGMRKAVFRQALDFAAYAGAAMAEFCGGEPLLYREFEWAVETARAEGFDLILRTNGYLLPARRGFIAENFSAVGISLDGDASGNDRMRPLRGASHMSAETKFEVPFGEIAALKAANPEIFVVLASVASAENVESILALGRILVQRKPPIDLWKIYQFLPNNFRAAANRDQFMLDNEVFDSLQGDLEKLVETSFPLSCRKASEIDGSCLVINRDGEVLLGAHCLGSVVSDTFDSICQRLESSGAAEAISANKSTTYRSALSISSQ